MRKLFLILGLALTMFVSCKKDNNGNGNGNGNSNTPTLSLSQKADITIQSNAQKQSIVVNTNQSSWDVKPTEAWITTTKKDNILNLDIAANESQDSRVATITVTAGQLEASFKITQTGKNASIELTPNRLDVTSEASKHTVNVKSTNAWNTEYEKADWFTLTEDKTANTLTFDVKENTSQAKRNATVTVKDDKGTTAQLTLTQKGVVVQYILPNLEPLAGETGIKEFEGARDSELLQNQDPNLTNVFIFKTTSDLFPLIQYSLSGSQTETILQVAKDETVIDDKFAQALKDAGFTEKTDGSGKFYTKDTTASDSYTYRIQVSSSTQTVEGQTLTIVQYNYFPLQKTEMPTISGLSLGYLIFEDSALEKVKAWEIEQGNTYDTLYSNSGKHTYWFNIPDNDDKLIVRGYVFDDTDSKIMQSVMEYNDATKFVYIVNDRIYLTNEFQDLLEKEQYKLSGYQEGIAFYQKEGTNYYLGLEIIFNEGSYIVCVYIVPKPASGASVAAIAKTNPFTVKPKSPVFDISKLNSRPSMLIK